MVRILVVEDNKELLELVAGYFKNKGSFDVYTAPDGTSAMKLIDGKDFDIAILDVMLPGASGFEIAAAARQAGRTLPILMLTARSAVEDKVIGLMRVWADGCGEELRKEAQRILFGLKG